MIVLKVHEIAVTNRDCNWYKQEIRSLIKLSEQKM